MNSQLGMCVADGVLVPIGNELANDTTNMYHVNLIYPVLGTKDGIETRHTEHIFTAKELKKASIRYYSELEQLEGITISNHSKTALIGYIRSSTYVCKNGTVSTRFIVRFDASACPELDSGCALGLFSARELVRSQLRINRYRRYKTPWYKRLFKWW